MNSAIDVLRVAAVGAASPFGVVDGAGVVFAAGVLGEELGDLALPAAFAPVLLVPAFAGWLGVAGAVVAAVVVAGAVVAGAGAAVDVVGAAAGAEVLPAGLAVAPTANAIIAAKAVSPAGITLRTVRRVGLIFTRAPGSLRQSLGRQLPRRTDVSRADDCDHETEDVFRSRRTSTELAASQWIDMPPTSLAQ